MSRARLNKNSRRKSALERLKAQLAAGPNSNSKRNDKKYMEEQIKILEAKVTNR